LGDLSNALIPNVHMPNQNCPLWGAGGACPKGETADSGTPGLHGTPRDSKGLRGTPRDSEGLQGTPNMCGVPESSKIEYYIFFSPCIIIR
jgi:hypothetical protein